MMKLSRVQREILHLLTEERLTVKQIAQRRKTTKSAVRKIVRKLKHMGAYGVVNQKRTATPPGPTPLRRAVHKLRLHAEQYRIKLLWAGDSYYKRVARGNVLRIDGNTVKLHRKVVEIYSGQSFYGDDEDAADGRAVRYWDRFGHRLEHELNVLLIKPRVNNWSRVRQEFATTDSELAKAQESRGERRIMVYTTDDGKLWFSTDHSLTAEHETHHKDTAKPDSQMVNSILNKWRDGVTMLPEEMQVLLVAQIDIVTQVAQSQLNLVKQVEVIIKLLGGGQKPPQDADNGPRPDYFG